MSMPHGVWSRSRRNPAGARLLPLRVLTAALLGVAAALLVSCSSSGKGLIPTGNAGPLKGDFELVAQSAEAGHGSCASTEAALLKTERDFAALPATVDAGLRQRLRRGIAKLHDDALALCGQPLAPATATTTAPRTTTSTETTPTTPPTTPSNTQTVPSTTTPTISGPGGTPPGEGEGEGEGGNGKAKGHSHGGGSSGGALPGGEPEGRK